METKMTSSVYISVIGKPNPSDMQNTAAHKPIADNKWPFKKWKKNLSMLIAYAYVEAMKKKTSLSGIQMAQTM